MRFKIGPVDFTQPSTWRGAIGLAGLFGISLSPELTHQIAMACGAALSAIELFRNEDAARKEAVPSLVLHRVPATAAVAADRLRRNVPTDAETPRNPESPGFGDR